MKTVQMTLDEALRTALARCEEEELERRHRAGYVAKPVEPGELDGWDDEQVWTNPFSSNAPRSRPRSRA